MAVTPRRDHLHLVLALALFSLLLFFVWDKWPPLLLLDQGAVDDLHRFTLDHPVFATAMRTLSVVGSGPVYLTAFTVVASWLWYRGQRRLAAFALVTPVGGAVLNELMKAWVDRARPVVANPVHSAAGLSFPSGHAQAAVVTYTTLLLIFWPMLRPVWRRVALACATVMVLGIGLSRLALAVHYVSDVLAGYALGAAWVVLIRIVLCGQGVGWRATTMGDEP